jgi:hypothetical protein
MCIWKKHEKHDPECYCKNTSIILTCICFQRSPDTLAASMMKSYSSTFLLRIKSTQKNEIWLCWLTAAGSLEQVCTRGNQMEKHSEQVRCKWMSFLPHYIVLHIHTVRRLDNYIGCSCISRNSVRRGTARNWHVSIEGSVVTAVAGSPFSEECGICHLRVTCRL